MTKEKLVHRAFLTDCEFAYLKRQFQRFIDQKYNNTRVVGFITDKQRNALKIQKDVEAKYFGTQKNQIDDVAKIFE